MEDDRMQLICFKICGEKFAFNTEYLVEIVQTQRSDVIPFFSPIPIIRGKWDYRGSSLYVIDLRDFFALEETIKGGERVKTLLQAKNGTLMSSENPHDQKAVSFEEFEEEDSSKSMIVVKIQERMFGLLTDTVLQVLPFGDFYEYPSMLSILPGRYFAGVTIIDGELVILLAIEEFIKDHEIDALVERERESEELVHQLTE